MPTINFPKGIYQQVRLVTQPLKEGSAGEGKKLNNERVKTRSEENRLNLELGKLSNKRQTRTLLISKLQKEIRHHQYLKSNRPTLKETIEMYKKLCPTDCHNIICVFEDLEDLSPSEQRTLETVKKIRELQDIRHQDNLRRNETRKRLAVVKNNGR